ncbi:MAG: hypothetical protein FJ387_06620 [Verrucomicrobia bacterium]|nr:hypothetical protein [Verrucomicrobiota bacterium]
MREINPGSNEVRFIKGRTEAGDAGAGIFEWDPNYPAVPDDGATIIKPNSSSSSWSSSSPGRWIRQVDVRGPVHAEWFGAKADGSTNDLTAIQNCLDTFGRVTLLAKTYRIEGPIKLKSGYTVEGQGMDKTIVKNMTAGSGGQRLSAIETYSETLRSPAECRQTRGKSAGGCTGSRWALPPRGVRTWWRASSWTGPTWG